MPVTKGEPDPKKVGATIKDFDGVVSDLKKLMDKLAQMQKAAAREPQAVVEAMKPLSAAIKELDGQLKDLKTIDKQVDAFASG
jgi:hypothetical protein